jgi:hypothetical protein
MNTTAPYQKDKMQMLKHVQHRQKLGIGARGVNFFRMAITERRTEASNPSYAAKRTCIWNVSAFSVLADVFFEAPHLHQSVRTILNIYNLNNFAVASTVGLISTRSSLNLCSTSQTYFLTVKKESLVTV